MHAGHGGKYNVLTGTAVFSITTRVIWSTGPRHSRYLLNCNNGAFDTDCIAEYFMLN